MTNPDGQPRPLTAAELEILEFARETWRTPGRKATAILERFGHNTHRYHQRLNAVLTLPAAEIYDPPLVRRLRARHTTTRPVHAPTWKANL